MSLPKQPISPDELRRIFNDGGVWERTQTGEYRERLLQSRHANPRECGEPFCTESQIVGYFAPDGRRVALVHQYLRPNGRIGASGRPDPKALVHDGALLVATPRFDDLAS